jgi:hypothetical protein
MHLCLNNRLIHILQDEKPIRGSSRGRTQWSAGSETVDQFVWKAFALVEAHASFTLASRRSPLATRADAVDVRSLFTFWQ